MKKIITLFLIISILSLSCTTTDHRVLIQPISGTTPISASGYLVDDAQDIVSPNDYTIVKHFTLELQSFAPVAESSIDEMSISPVLMELIRKNNADGIVNLQIYGMEYDPGTTGIVGGTKIFGTIMAGSGGFFLVMAAMLGDDEYLLPYGLGFLATGGFGVLGSYGLKASSQSVWTIGVEGDLYRYRE
jgi:hypothetical protein